MRGRIRVASSPPPARLPNSRLPPWSSAMPLAMLGPSPVPPVARLREGRAAQVIERRVQHRLRLLVTLGGAGDSGHVDELRADTVVELLLPRI